MVGDRVIPGRSQGMRDVGREVKPPAKAPKAPSVRRTSEILSEPFALGMTSGGGLLVDHLSWGFTYSNNPNGSCGCRMCHPMFPVRVIE